MGTKDEMKEMRGMRGREMKRERSDRHVLEVEEAVAAEGEPPPLPRLVPAALLHQPPALLALEKEKKR